MSEIGNRKSSAKERAFVIEFVLCRNGTQAAIKAKYSKKSATAIASELLRKPSIRAAIEKLEAEIASPKIMNIRERQERLSEIGRGRLTDFVKNGKVELEEDTPNAGAAKEFYRRDGFDRDGNPVATSSIKLTDPIEAIRELNKLGGDYPPSRHLVGHRVVFEVIHIDRGKREEIEEGKAPAIAGSFKELEEGEEN